MGSINSARPGNVGPQPLTSNTTGNTLPPANITIDENRQIQIHLRTGPGPGPGPGPGVVNAPIQLAQPRSMLPREYIEISSPAASPSLTGKDDKTPPSVPSQRTAFRLQHLPSPRSLLSRQPPSPSSQGLAANRPIFPAANGPVDFARYLSPINPLLQRDISMYGNGMNPNEHIDDSDALDIKDAGLAKIMEDEFHAQMIARRCGDNNPFSSNQQIIDQPLTVGGDKDAAIDKVLMVFPSICIKHVLNLYDSISQDADRIVAHILEDMDSGKAYPKEKDTKSTLKRKREIDEDEEAALKYGAAERWAGIGPFNLRTMRMILSEEFPEMPMTFIDSCLRKNANRLFLTYRVLEETERTYSTENPPYIKNRTRRKMQEGYREANIAAFIDNIRPYDPDHVDMLQELQVARRIRKNAESKREEGRQSQLAEEANLLKARAEGTMLDCQCCFFECPMNRMIHCDSEKDMHWFCKDCAKRNAETVIGQSKYQLVCMAMEDCTSSFSIAQRALFLDDKMNIALERNEQEANLRMAGIENLASCPFCPYAAEYPPVEIDKEFRCDAPECEKVSCRLCKLESHIPKSCQENAKETGLSARRRVEEAMSEALIRKCNKCGTPFVKEDGCNKMTCTRDGCYNVQCYVCSKSCTYTHFNDIRRGGKIGNCPLFEKTSERHEQEVRRAEKEVLEQLLTEYPEYVEKDLKIKLSANVIQDEEQRRTNDVVPGAAVPPVYPGYARFGLGMYGPGSPEVQNVARNPMERIFGEPPNQPQEPRAGGAALNAPAIENVFDIPLAIALENQRVAPDQRLRPLGVPNMPFHHGRPLVAPRAPSIRHAPHQLAGGMINQNININNVLHRADQRFMNFMGQRREDDGNDIDRQPAPQANPQVEQDQLNIGVELDMFGDVPRLPPVIDEGQRRYNLWLRRAHPYYAQPPERRVNVPSRSMAPNRRNGQ